MRASPVVVHHRRVRSEQPPAPTRRPRYGHCLEGLRPLASDSPRQEAEAGRSELQRRLTLLDRQIAEGREQFARQLQIVAVIEGAQGDSTVARDELQHCAHAHVVRLDDRDSLMRQLEGASD